jgi:hypothetical protein
MRELAKRTALEIGTPAPRGQLDLRKVTSRLLKPLQICRDLAPAIAIVEKAAPNFNRNIHGELMRPHTELEGAARELAAVLPNSDVVEAALGEINRALTEPCDPDIARVLVGALLAGFGVRPGEDAEIRLAAMTLAVEDISEDESGTPAASAARARCRHRERLAPRRCVRTEPWRALETVSRTPRPLESPPPRSARAYPGTLRR